MASGNEVVVSAIQITAVDGEIEATREKVSRLLDVAGARGSDLVVLPEVWTGLAYSQSDLYRKTAETIPGPSTDLLAAKAKEHGMHIVGSIYERGNEAYFNTSPMVDPSGAIVGKYVKTHLFDAPGRVDIAPGIRESDKVKAGNELPVFDTAIGKIGVSVCSDLRFPEVYRVLALKGARIIVCASAFLSPRFDHWEFFMRARAAENQVFVVASGQYGVEPKSGIGFVGRSMIVDPWGIVIAQAGDRPCTLVADLDFEQLADTRRRVPALGHRRL